MRLCLSNWVRPGREWFPSPLGDFNRLYEGLIGELFKIWHWNMSYFLKWHQSDPWNVNLYHCCAGKASWMQCPLHNQKVNKPSFHGASCQLAPLNTFNTQSTVLTNISVMVASVVYGEWRWQPYQNLLNSVFIPYMSANVIECRSIGSCSSSGLCAGLMITGFHFQLLFTLPPSDTECQ